MSMDDFKTEAEYEQSVLWEIERKKQIEKEIAASKHRLKELFAKFRAAKWIVFVFLTFISCTSGKDKRISELESELSAANERIEELEGKLDEVQSGIEEAKSSISSARDDVDNASVYRNWFILDDAVSELDDAESCLEQIDTDH